MKWLWLCSSLPHVQAVGQEVTRVLLGEYNQNIDAKGRVNIPSKFRDDLGQTFVVSKGLDGCIALYPRDEWKAFMERIISENPTQRRKLIHFFSSGAKECELDTQGRVVIPPEHRAYAGLDKEITVVGSYKNAEVWDRARWQAYNADEALDAEEIAKAMEAFGL